MNGKLNHRIPRPLFLLLATVLLILSTSMRSYANNAQPKNEVASKLTALGDDYIHSSKEIIDMWATGKQRSADIMSDISKLLDDELPLQRIIPPERPYNEPTWPSDPTQHLVSYEKYLKDYRHTGYISSLAEKLRAYFNGDAIDNEMNRTNEVLEECRKKRRNCDQSDRALREKFGVAIAFRAEPKITVKPFDNQHRLLEAEENNILNFMQSSSELYPSAVLLRFASSHDSKYAVALQDILLERAHKEIAESDRVGATNAGITIFALEIFALKQIQETGLGLGLRQGLVDRAMKINSLIGDAFRNEVGAYRYYEALEALRVAATNCGQYDVADRLVVAKGIVRATNSELTPSFLERVLLQIWGFFTKFGTSFYRVIQVYLGFWLLSLLAAFPHHKWSGGWTAIFHGKCRIIRRAYWLLIAGSSGEISQALRGVWNASKNSAKDAFKLISLLGGEPETLTFTLLKAAYPVYLTIALGLFINFIGRAS